MLDKDKGAFVFIKNLFFVSLLLIIVVANVEATRAETYTSVEPAGDTYLLQGEYSGTADAWGGAWGAQVVALANSEFDVVLFPGGLPGDGFRADTAKKQINAKADGKTAVGSSESFHITVGDNSLAISDLEDKPVGVLTKVNRQSVTLGAPAPEGSVVLFDGSNVDKFRDATLIDGRYLGSGCESLESFGDHQLHIEFCTPFMPKDRGQARGNSGVYVQGRYEVQVLDSFGLESKDNDCGGIYQVAKPLVNMCYPPLVWQTYDIDLTAAKYDAQGAKTSNALISVKQNGIVIHDSLELPGHTPGKSQEANSPGPLYLQDHGNPVVFQNIWIVKK